MTIIMIDCKQGITRMGVEGHIVNNDWHSGSSDSEMLP